MVMPGRTVALAPRLAPVFTQVSGRRDADAWMRGSLSLVKATLGPTSTSSSRRTPSTSCAPHLTITRLPTTTSDSMKTWSWMVQSLPMTAPGRTWLKAPIRVPLPTDGVSTSAWG